jgi:HlyD family secretion protein
MVGYLGLAFSGAWERSVRVPAATVTVDIVRRGVFHDFTPLRGKIAPHDTIYLDALEGGQVAKVMAHAGDMVRAGQPLVAFRNTQLELDVLDREGRLVESITQLHAYEKQLEDTRLANEKAAAEIDFNITRLTRAATRTDILTAKGYDPPQMRDQVHDELDYDQRLRPLQAVGDARQDDLRRQQLPQIQSELASLRDSLKITRAKLDDLVVRAPVDGRLTDLVQNLGENRNRGERLGEITPNTGFKIAATVDEFYLDRVRVGQTATASFDGRDQRLRVDRVYPQVKDGTFSVDLTFQGPTPDGLLSGEAVDGSLQLGDDQPALILPAGAFLERTGGDWVMVVDVGGRHAERRRVKIGRRNAEQVEILSGVRPGERVITSDYTAFDKVDRVNLAP